MEKPKGEGDWSKILTAGGGLIAAFAALLTALNAIGVIGRQAASPTATPVVPRETPTATALLVRVEDDFSDPTTGWDIGADSDAEWGYQDGEYRILVHSTELVVWANPHERYDLANLAVVVEARSVSGPVDNEYGVIIRYVDRSNYYLFTVSSDGMCNVRRIREDVWYTLEPWAPSSAVRQGQATNLLRVEARGTEFKFFANDELLTTVKDATFASGSFGLAASTFAEGEVQVRFDNLLVRELP